MEKFRALWWFGLSLAAAPAAMAQPACSNGLDCYTKAIQRVQSAEDLLSDARKEIAGFQKQIDDLKKKNGDLNSSFDSLKQLLIASSIRIGMTGIGDLTGKCNKNQDLVQTVSFEGGGFPTGVIPKVVVMTTGLRYYTPGGVNYAITVQSVTEGQFTYKINSGGDCPDNFGVAYIAIPPPPK